MQRTSDVDETPCLCVRLAKGHIRSRSGYGTGQREAEKRRGAGGGRGHGGGGMGGREQVRTRHVLLQSVTEVSLYALARTGMGGGEQVRTRHLQCLGEIGWRRWQSLRPTSMYGCPRRDIRVTGIDAGMGAVPACLCACRRGRKESLGLACDASAVVTPTANLTSAFDE
jgi:hypothetical protein